MIPTVLLLSLIAGRWWRLAPILSAIAWPLVLLQTGTIDGAHEFLQASALALANGVAGVALFQAAAFGLRAAGQRVHTPPR